MKQHLSLIFAGLYLFGVHANGQTVDFWDEETRIFGTAPAGKHIQANATRLPAPGFTLDHTDKRTGDLRVVYTPVKAKNAKRFGFFADLWGQYWKLSKDFSLKLQLKTTGTGNGKDAPEIVLNAATDDIPTVGGEPVNYSYPNVFESPYLFSKYNSGTVTIRHGDKTLTLDFMRQFSRGVPLYGK